MKFLRENIFISTFNQLLFKLITFYNMCSIASPISNVSHFRDTVSPHTKRRLINCPNGCKSENVSAELVIDCQHFTCMCTKCDIKWYICLNCQRQHSHFKKIRQLRRHQSSCKMDGLQRSTSNFPLHHNLGGTQFFSYFEFMEFPHFGRNEDRKFYFHNQNSLGLSYIVGWSQFHLPNISSFLRKDEVHSQIRIADLVLGLFPKKVSVFTKLMSFFNNELKKMTYDGKWRCELPTSNNLIRKFYKDGKYAIHPNLPHPDVETIYGHSYVPLNQIIQDALANDCSFDPIYKAPESGYIHDLNESPFCHELSKSFPKRENTIDLLMTRWSDDFEPFNIKSNKGNSVWIFTVTIYCKSISSHSNENTYVVSMGLKNDDHDPIEKRFINDLNRINNDNSQTFYKKGSKGCFSVRVHLVASLCDLPERYNRCCITRGNGSHTSRWGYLCDVKKLENHLAPCNVCALKLRSSVSMKPTNIFSTTCDKCTSWSMKNNVLLSTTVPDKLKDSNTNSDNQLGVRTSDFTTLKNAFKFCYEKMKNGEWSSSESSLYMSMYGINPKLQTSLINNAENEYNFKQIFDLPKNESNTLFNKILENRSVHPHMYNIPDIPPSWNFPHGITSFIDAPMHLIFLGCVKLVNKRILDWSALFKKETKLLQSFSSIIPSIYDLQLEWCKIFPLSTNTVFSGYVSENWLAVARLSRWMYSLLPQILKDGSYDTSHPNTDVFKWTGAELRKWLALRDLPRKGKVYDLKEIVRKYMSSPETIPPISSRYSCPIETITNTLATMNGFIQRLMQDKYTHQHIDETENYIKLFLTSLNEWDSRSKLAGRKPIWLLSYSLLNLLNFPTMMRKYGPVRNLWEGSSMGEGILRIIKPNIILRRNNAISVSTTKFYQQKSLNRLIKQVAIDEGEEIPIDISFMERSSNFHIYDNYQNIIDAYHNMQPISIIIDRENNIYAVSNGEIYSQFIIEILDSKIIGHNYFQISPPHRLNSMNQKIETVDFGLMLPKLNLADDDGEQTFFGIYTIITSDWKEIDENKNFGFFKFATNFDESEYTIIPSNFGAGNNLEVTREVLV